MGLSTVLGRLYQQHCPDFVLRDDLENALATESRQITNKIIRLLDEASDWIACRRVSLKLGNVIIEYMVRKCIRTLTEGACGPVRCIPIIDRAGQVSGADKFVERNTEAVEANREIQYPTQRKISLKSKWRGSNAGWSSRVRGRDAARLDPQR